MLVTDREYVTAGGPRLVRPDELLQMFGRAGRRGLDDKGYVLVAPGKPRLGEARPLLLKRANPLDWPSFLAFMHQAVKKGESPALAAAGLARRLFTDPCAGIGTGKISANPARRKFPATRLAQKSPVQTLGSSTAGAGPSQKIVEMLNSAGQWERRRPPVKVKLGAALAYEEGAWMPALKFPQSLAGVELGNLCRLGGEDSRYGRQVALAVFPKESGKAKITLVKWVHKSLCHHWRQTRPNAPMPSRHWELEAFEKQLLPLLPLFTSGGRPAGNHRAQRLD